MKAIDTLKEIQEGITSIIEIEDQSPTNAYDWAILAQAVLELEEMVLKVDQTANSASSHAYSIGRER